MVACTETGGKKGRGSIVSIGFNEGDKDKRGGRGGGWRSRRSKLTR